MLYPFKSALRRKNTHFGKKNSKFYEFETTEKKDRIGDITRYKNYSILDVSDIKK